MKAGGGHHQVRASVGFYLAVAGVLLLSAAGAATAAREPVLNSVTAPHSYYWRELYLPQLTSGPSGAAFSPDGSELVYSMAGSLWRQRIGEGEAIELTHGPGYDYQPDWSRDGRWVVFVRHQGDALELWALDLEGAPGQAHEHALTVSGVVNVEPRFSPDGTRLAFVSTREGGQFNVWTARFADGRLEQAAPLLPLRESAVKRYYYAATDHVINPSWSPDGRQLYVVTNREVAWGTGDIWRLPLADPAAGERLIREETSWAARPEISPDGRRLLYASYHGRQWHQLWLASAGGESPMPLTFGDFDRRHARWSPDGRRVLYVSNEHGNTELWVQEVVGGARVKVAAAVRRYRRVMATLAVAVRDEAGRAVPARVAVLAADRRHYAPVEAWVHADDSFDRAVQAHEDHYFHCDGDCRLTVPRGRVTVRVQRGLEYLPAASTIQALSAAGARDGSSIEAPPLIFRLVPNRLPGSFGSWTSLDQHVHMNYGGHYRHEPLTLARQARAEDLDVVYNLVVNKEQRVNDIASFGAAPFHAPGVTVFHGQEYHTSYWGHLALLHLGDHFLTPDFAAYRHSGFVSPFPHNGVIADLAHAQGALVGYVHPYDWAIVPEREKSLTHQFPADVAHGKVDYFEVVSFSDPRSNDQVWHRLLNLGYRIPAGAGTDAMANYASLRGPVGVNRLFVPEVASEAGALAEHEPRLDSSLDPAALVRALRGGRGFVTNAPLLGLRVEGAAPGDTLRPTEPRNARFEAAVRSIVPLDHIELLVNGKVVQSFSAPNGRDGDWSGQVRLEASGWVALRAYADDSDPWVADLYPYGHTNPVWVEVAGRPPRSPEDARYFVRWLDRVLADATARDDYNDEAERKATLEYLAEARVVFEEQAPQD